MKQSLLVSLTLNVQVRFQVEVLPQTAREVTTVVEIRLGMDQAVGVHGLKAQRGIRSVEQHEINSVQALRRQIGKDVKLVRLQLIPWAYQGQIDVAARLRPPFRMGAEQIGRLDDLKASKHAVDPQAQRFGIRFHRRTIAERGE